MKTETPTFLVFDVESIGLHGEGFAVAGGVYIPNGSCQEEFSFACDPDTADGNEAGKKWVGENVPILKITHRNPFHVREAFFLFWENAQKKHPGIVMAAECGWPVEARFVASCIDDHPTMRGWMGPYPLHEIASFMLAIGIDPMEPWAREASELPAHNPLSDSRLSARILFKCINYLRMQKQCAEQYNEGPSPFAAI